MLTVGCETPEEQSDEADRLRARIDASTLAFLGLPQRG